MMAGRILLPDGTEATDRMLGLFREEDADSVASGAVLKAAMTYISGLTGLSMPATQRASDPFKNHPWVYAAASAAALNASSVRYVVWKETKDVSTAQLKRGVVPKQGRRRRAVNKYLSKKYRAQGFEFRGLEEDLDNPLSDVFTRPNPVSKTGMQLWFITNLWMFLRGEAFWLCLNEEGDPVPYTSEDVAEIWPVSPDLVQEQMSGNLLKGWWMSMGNGSGSGIGSGIFLELDELVQFKFPDPAYPIRGMSPMTAAAAGINLDMLAVRHNTGVMNNGAEPGGLLVHEGPGAPYKNDKEKKEFEEKWEQRHKGAGNDRKVGLLTGGWKYVPVSLSVKDMDFLAQRKWTREEVLGVMGIPASVLAITEKINFASSLAQDRNFWDKKLIPMLQLYEQTLDATLFFDLPDSTLGGFDLSKVEALKIGLSDKVKTCMDLCGTQLHMDPRTAFEIVGIDVPDYEGDDIVLLVAGLQTLKTLDAANKAAVKEAENPTPPPAPPGMPGVPSVPGSDANKPPGKQTPSQDPNRSPTTEPKKGVTLWVPGARLRRASKTWELLMKQVQQPAERRMRLAWQGYVRAQKVKQLKAFDKSFAGIRLASVVRRLKGVEEDVDRLLLDLTGAQEELLTAFEPIYADELASTAEVTADELGLEAFDLSDPILQDAMQARLDVLEDTAPDTLIGDVRESITEGMEAGDTLLELRTRVADVMDASAEASKALMIARTESVGLMNDAREAVFDDQEFDGREWVDSHDDHVRGDHVVFGSLGPKRSGFNYMSAVGKPGTLRYPSDPQAPVDQIINCRCVHVPA